MGKTSGATAMTSATLTKVKQIASHLTSTELHGLRAWAEEMANKKWRREKEHEMRSYPIGARLVLGHVGLEGWDGQVVTLTEHRRLKFTVERADKRRLWIRYSSWNLIKGFDSPQNRSMAEIEVDINRKVVPTLNKILQGEGLKT